MSGPKSSSRKYEGSSEINYFICSFIQEMLMSKPFANCWEHSDIWLLTLTLETIGLYDLIGCWASQCSSSTETVRGWCKREVQSLSVFFLQWVKLFYRQGSFASISFNYKMSLITANFKILSKQISCVEILLIKFALRISVQFIVSRFSSKCSSIYFQLLII